MKTMVVGASENENRYSYKAIQLLNKYGHEIVALSNKKGRIGNIEFETEKKDFKNIDTISLYINQYIQTEYFDYIIRIKPRRVIFNPGTENEALMNLLSRNSISFIEACTLVLLRTAQY